MQLLCPTRVPLLLYLEPLGRLLDVSWAKLGASKPHSKRNLAPLGPKLALQTALQVQLGASWVDVWCSCNPQNRALAYTRARFSCLCDLAFQDCLLSSTCKLLAAFGALGRHFGALGCHLGALGRHLEPLGRHSGALGCIWGSTWSLQGPFWGQLGPSGGVFRLNLAT